MKRASLLLVAGWLMVRAASGQFYAPETDFHDLCQRRFRSKRRACWHGIATWTARESRTWIFAWRNLPSTKAFGPSNGAMANRGVAQGDGEVSGEALLTGPAWYRNVWLQLTDKDWRAPKQPRGRSCGAFWRGVEGAGISRIEGLTAAFHHLHHTAAAAKDAAMLAEH